MSKVLVTGAAGFIGYHLSERLLARGDEVLGLDNLNDYYDVSLKEARLARLQAHENFHFEKLDIADAEGLQALFQQHTPTHVVNLAAQAGVRYSLLNPMSYVQSNLVGFVNILECCRHFKVAHLVYASSSSVYGANTKVPFSTQDSVDHPVSLYAATKKSNELMAHSYSHLFSLPTTGLRFFTVYGPWGRPDMALFLFTRAILEGKPIKVFNHGNMQRDFTYVDDIVEGVIRVLDRPPSASTDQDLPRDPGRSHAPFRVYNIGKNQPVPLMEMIQTLEACLGKEAEKEMLPMQPGDVYQTYADVSSLIEEFDFRPDTSIQEGIAQFVAWYQSFYHPQS